MIRISTKKAEELHALLIRETGGTPDVRDRDLLDSALFAAFQTFGGEELYPTLAEKGARLGYSLIANHAFLDGNKRIGMLLMLTFLEVNGIRLKLDDNAVVSTGLAVAGGKMNYEQLLAWIRQHQ